jgi:hypothetical protein
MEKNFKSHSKTTVVCLAFHAGRRMIAALKAWRRELKWEDNPDLTTIVNGLTTPYDNAVGATDAAAQLLSPPPWDKMLDALEDHLSKVNSLVIVPWKQTHPTGLYPNLFTQWKAANPLAGVLDDLEQWYDHLVKEWSNTEADIVRCCLPFVLPEATQSVTFFIASSNEGSQIAEAIRDAVLTKEPSWVACYWKDPAAFRVGGSALESLEETIGGCHFGIYVMTADDKLKIRKTTTVSARGNVIFEYGIGVGRHGRLRSFVVHDEIHKISDIHGITTIPFKAVATGKGRAWMSRLFRLKNFFHTPPSDSEIKQIADRISEGVRKQIAESRKP